MNGIHQALIAGMLISIQQIFWDLAGTVQRHMAAHRDEDR